MCMGMENQEGVASPFAATSNTFRRSTLRCLYISIPAIACTRIIRMELCNLPIWSYESIVIVCLCVCVFHGFSVTRRNTDNTGDIRWYQVILVSPHFPPSQHGVGLGIMIRKTAPEQIKASCNRYERCQSMSVILNKLKSDATWDFLRDLCNFDIVSCSLPFKLFFAGWISIGYQSRSYILGYVMIRTCLLHHWW